MKITHIMTSAVLATSFAMCSIAMLPMVAQADSPGTDAAIGAAVGTIVGQLLFDSHRQQYYYVRGHRRFYVDRDTARRYHQRRNHGDHHDHHDH